MTHWVFAPRPSWAARPAAAQVRGGHASWGCLSFPSAPPPRLLPGQRVVVWRRTWVSSLSASGSSVSELWGPDFSEGLAEPAPRVWTGAERGVCGSN